MKVIIFGATGGIGRHSVTRAKLNGYESTVFVRNAAKVKTLTM